MQLARKVGKLCSTSKRSMASRLYCYVRYDLPELVLPSGIPDPPGTAKPVKLSLLEHGEVQPRMVLPPATPPRGTNPGDNNAVHSVGRSSC
jgi:hypothetical protein